MRVLSVLGTRPEVIKMVSVLNNLEKYPDIFESVVCVTAQHRHMLDQMMNLFDIRPDIDLDLMTEDQALSALTAKAIIALTDTVNQVKPDVVLVQGDTTTAMVASLAAFYEKIPVGHVEAGMRTLNRYYPFPEEINRRLISELATFHFAPTLSAAQSLYREGISAEIFITGSTNIDALKLILNQSYSYNFDFPRDNHKLILVTAHRRENIGSGLENICVAIQTLVERNMDIEIVYPVHPNPNVRNTVEKYLSNLPRVHLTDPLSYQPFVHLLNRAYLVLTDSGGIQGEAPALGIPVLVLRRETEWPESIQAGTAKLVGTDPQSIIDETEQLLSDQDKYQSMARAVNPYGDGHAAEKIVSILMDRSLQNRSEKAL